MLPRLIKNTLCVMGSTFSMIGFIGVLLYLIFVVTGFAVYKTGEKHDLTRRFEIEIPFSRANNAEMINAGFRALLPEGQYSLWIFDRRNILKRPENVSISINDNVLTNRNFRAYEEKDSIDTKHLFLGYFDAKEAMSYFVITARIENQKIDSIFPTLVVTTYADSYKYDVPSELWK